MTSPLVEHAIRELEFAGVEEDVRPSIIAAVEAFASYGGHSGHSAAITIHILEKLLNFENISPLTNNPDEWMMVTDGTANDGGEPIWQSTRNAEAFSNDGGQTYYCLSERTRRWFGRGFTKVLHRSETYIP